MAIPLEAHGCTHLRGLSKYERRHQDNVRGDRFGRLFGDELPPLFTDPRILEQIGALEIDGAPGPMNGGNNPPETETVAVGHVFFGQFVDHDITLDVESSFDRVNEAGEISNSRTPTLDLDCLYGGGPEATPHLYVQEGPFKSVKLITGEVTSDGAFAAFDLPRVRNVALIGDPRNDENRVLSQIQLAMIRFHNRICDDLQANYPDDRDRGELFEAARELVTWHYQWCVVHDFLVNMCGQPVVDRILAGGRSFYQPNEPFIPVEFSVAAFRFGHSMVPMSVQTRTNQPRRELFGTKLGRGFRPVSDAEGACDMHELFETHEARIVQRASRMDAKLARDLLQLTTNVVDAGENSLATRNLIRGQSFRLPSGETIAERMGIDPDVIDAVTAAVQADAPDLVSGTPLWFYILKEAEVIGRARHDGPPEQGEGLGPVGAQIVAEVVIGLIELDERSWLSQNRNWRPQSFADDANVTISTVGNMLSYAQPDLPAV